MSRIPTEGIDYTSKDYESFRSDMIKKLLIKMPEYTDTRQSDAGIVILELLAQGLDIISYYQDVIANEVYLVTEEQRSNALKWCQILGYVPRSSSPSEFYQVFVLNSVQEEDTIIPKGTIVKTQGSSVEPSVYFETADDLIIPAGKLGNEKDNETYLYKVRLMQGLTVSNEFVGTSTGASEQTFKLGYTPVILDSINLYVNEGNGFYEWERVDNFIDSTDESRHYTAFINENDEAVITFGDGIFGKIPLAYPNGIVCNYRIGGGSQGNVGANKINMLDSNSAIVKETFNPETAYKEGQDKETLEEIKKNAPNAYRVKWGALTSDDFEDVILMNFPEVLKVAAYHGVEDRQDLDIFLVLKNDAEVTSEIKNSILDLFDANKGGRKIVGADVLTISPAKKVGIDIKATLSVKERYDFEKVKEQIVEYVTDYFAVGNIDFNSEFIPAILCANIMNPDNAIEGIKYFKISSPTYDSLPEGRGEIHTLSSITIVNGGA